MKKGRPSTTARFVAFARAAASAHPAGRAIARVAMLGLVDHVALRTAAVDAALAEAFPQVVILGAGLDERAYRLGSLADTRVFEVDHPASQELKIARVKGRTPRCRELAHVAVDFAEDDLEAALVAAGHDRTLATAWVLEGVTQYLPAATTTRLLEVVGRLSAPTSQLAATYVRPPEGTVASVVRRAFEVSLDRIGEPLRATYTADVFCTQLRDVGLEPRSDTCSVEWSARFGGSALLAAALRAERLVVAVR